MKTVFIFSLILASLFALIRADFGSNAKYLIADAMSGQCWKQATTGPNSCVSVQNTLNPADGVSWIANQTFIIIRTGHHEYINYLNATIYTDNTCTTKVLGIAWNSSMIVQSVANATDDENGIFAIFVGWAVNATEAVVVETLYLDGLVDTYNSLSGFGLCTFANTWVNGVPQQTNHAGANCPVANNCIENDILGIQYTITSQFPFITSEIAPGNIGPPCDATKRTYSLASWRIGHEFAHPEVCNFNFP